MTAEQKRQNGPFGRLALIRDADRGGYIGMVKDGETYAGFATVDPHGLIWSDENADTVAEAVIACWNACSDAGLTVEQLKNGIIKQAMADAANLDVMATALSRAMDRITELENTLNYGGSTGVRERAGEVIAYIVRDQDGKINERYYAYIVRDRDGKINERYHAAVDSRWMYGATANGLWCAHEDADRIGGTVSAIMTDGEDTWEDGPSTGGRQPLVNKLVNQKVSSGIKVGDYVFVSKYKDCDPGDAWAVGHVSLIDVGDAKYGPYVELAVTGARRKWRHATVITEWQGNMICEALPGLEHLPDGARTMAAAAVLGPVLGGSLPNDDL